MKLLLLQDSRITVKAGEIVEVSPAEAGFLMSTRHAVIPPANWKQEPVNRKPARENPEFEKLFERPEATADAIVDTVDAIPETPEKTETKKARTTRKK